MTSRGHWEWKESPHAGHFESVEAASMRTAQPTRATRHMSSSIEGAMVANTCEKVGAGRSAAKVKLARIAHIAPWDGPRLVRTRNQTFFDQKFRLVREKSYLCGFWTQIWYGFTIGPPSRLSGVLLRSQAGTLSCHPESPRASHLN